ncbi:hypothetical protein S245_017893 [Arachis hypogaea]
MFLVVVREVVVVVVFLASSNSISSSGNQIVPLKSVTKKKRNLPGVPGTNKNGKKRHFCFLPSSDFIIIFFLKYMYNLHFTYPYAEVIALSPKILLATNRFMCQICNKNFQRDQNL